MDKYIFPREDKGAETFSKFNKQILLSQYNFLKTISDINFKYILCDRYDDFILVFDKKQVEIHQVKCRDPGLNKFTLNQITRKQKEQAKSILDKLIDNHKRFEKVKYEVKKLVLLTDGELNNELIYIHKYNIHEFKDEAEKDRIYGEIESICDRLSKNIGVDFNKTIFQKLQFHGRQGSNEQLINMIKNEIREIIKNYTLSEVIEIELPDITFEKLYLRFIEATENQSLEGSKIYKEDLFKILIDLTKKGINLNKSLYEDLVFKMASAQFDMDEINNAKMKIVEKFNIFAFSSSLPNIRKDLDELENILKKELYNIQKKNLGILNSRELDELYKNHINNLVNNLGDDFALTLNHSKKYLTGIFYENICLCHFDWIKRD